MNAPKDSMQLTIIQRAQVALGSPEYEKKLISLVEGSKIIVEITGSDSYAECHNARIALKRVRVEIEKAGKAAREDAQLFSRGMIAEEKRLVLISSPEEERLGTIETAYNERIKAEQAERERVEAARIATIQSSIQVIRDEATKAIGKPAIVIWAILETMKELEPDDSFAEFRVEAGQARDAAVARLTQLHCDTVEADADRAELAKLRAEKEQREREQQNAAAQIEGTQEQTGIALSVEPQSSGRPAAPAAPADVASLATGLLTGAGNTMRSPLMDPTPRQEARAKLLDFKNSDAGRMPEFAAITRAILYYFKENP